MSSSFRIVHLSDLHLTRSDGAARSEPQLLGKLTGMNSRFRALLADARVQACDLLLVTGDVTDRGDLASWRVFWTAVERAGLGKRALVLPGNHDVCSLGVRAPARRRERARRDLERALAGLRLGHRQPTRFPWVRLVHPSVAVFGLETNNLGNLTGVTNGVGQIGFRQLLTFGELLYTHRDLPVKIVALHHSPNIPLAATARRRGRRVVGRVERLAMAVPEADRRALRLLCASHRVRLIVHGHLHDAEDRRVNGLRIVGAPASTEPIHPGDSEVAFYEYRVGLRALRVNVRLLRAAVGEG